MSHSDYYDDTLVDRAIGEGRHREFIGGLWEEMGQLQMDFLRSQGLSSSHRLLDIGCGSLRLGQLAIPYLEPLRYFGTDISPDLIEAGYDRELSDADRLKAPKSHFHVSENFDFSFLDEPVDFAIAQSVFTHLPLNHLRRCLGQLASRMRTGGVLFVTFFECGSDQNLMDPIQHPGGGITSYDTRDPYHYYVSDLGWAIDQAPWRLAPIGNWGHPRGQHIAAFHRL